jgi:hypothetical protein
MGSISPDKFRPAIAPINRNTSKKYLILCAGVF